MNICRRLLLYMSTILACINWKQLTPIFDSLYVIKKNYSYSNQLFDVMILLFENILELDDLMYCVSPGQPFITIR